MNTPRASKSRYQIAWDNGHSCGVFAPEYTSYREAERAGAAWKRDMVAIEVTPAERREAREAYSWEVVEVEESTDPEQEEGFDPVRDGWVGKDGRP